MTQPDTYNLDSMIHISTWNECIIKHLSPSSSPSV